MLILSHKRRYYEDKKTWETKQFPLQDDTLAQFWSSYKSKNFVSTTYEGIHKRYSSVTSVSFNTDIYHADLPKPTANTSWFQTHVTMATRIWGEKNFWQYYICSLQHIYVPKWLAFQRAGRTPGPKQSDNLIKASTENFGTILRTSMFIISINLQLTMYIVCLVCHDSSL